VLLQVQDQTNNESQMQLVEDSQCLHMMTSMMVKKKTMRTKKKSTMTNTINPSHLRKFASTKKWPHVARLTWKNTKMAKNQPLNLKKNALITTSI
jgi:hypothetical protein